MAVRSLAIAIAALVLIGCVAAVSAKRLVAVQHGLRVHRDNGHGSGHDGDGDADADGEGEAESDASEAGEGAASTSNGVVELGDSAVLDEKGKLIEHEFDAVVGGDMPVLVFFYLPGCGYCQGFTPTYDRVGRAFRKQPVVIAKLDAGRWSKAADRYNVDNVPDIRYFPAKSTEAQEYRLARTAPQLVDFLNEQLGTAVKVSMNFRQRHSSPSESSTAKTRSSRSTNPILSKSERNMAFGTCPRPRHSAPPPPPPRRAAKPKSKH